MAKDPIRTAKRKAYLQTPPGLRKIRRNRDTRRDDGRQAFANKKQRQGRKYEETLKKYWERSRAFTTARDMDPKLVDDMLSRIENYLGPPLKGIPGKEFEGVPCREHTCHFNSTLFWGHGRINITVKARENTVQTWLHQALWLLQDQSRELNVDAGEIVYQRCGNARCGEEAHLGVTTDVKKIPITILEVPDVESEINTDTGMPNENASRSLSALNKSFAKFREETEERFSEMKERYDKKLDIHRRFIKAFLEHSDPAVVANVKKSVNQKENPTR